MAAAHSHGLPVISLSSADVYSPYVGDAEAEVRRAFGIAHQAAPCILFLDEIDALVTNRHLDGGSGGGSGGSSASVEARVLATLLTEMDGVCGGNQDRGVIVLAATNRVQCLDAALLRKGRFHHVLYVPPPDVATQLQLLQYFAGQSSLPAQSVQTMQAQLREGLSGAEVENLCREEAMRLLRIKLAAADSA
jgi:SpoVK/Ycf46/Vps4 family AAA+-type ATPase